MHHGPLVKWLRQRPLTPLTSVRIRYGSPDFSRAKVLDKGSEIQYNTVCSPARPDDIELVLIRARVHPFPFRTRQLSSFLLTILGWRRPGKITQRLHLSSNESCCFFFFCRDFAGDMSCASNTSCLGGSLFCSGLLADLNRAGDSFYQGGEFFAEIQRGVRRTTAVGKRVDTYGFYPLNSRFPLLLSLAQTRDRRPP